MKTTSGLVLPNPSLINENRENLSILPPISIFDIYQHLLPFSVNETLHNYNKLEGFTMYKDGHVLNVQKVTFPYASDYFAIKSQVKPRTKVKIHVAAYPTTTYGLSYHMYPHRCLLSLHIVTTKGP